MSHILALVLGTACMALFITLTTQGMHLKRIELILEASVVVNAAVIVVEVIIHHEGDGDGARRHQCLQHQLLVAGSIVAAHVTVIADIGAGTRRVRDARIILKNSEKHNRK